MSNWATPIKSPNSKFSLPGLGHSFRKKNFMLIKSRLVLKNHFEGVVPSGIIGGPLKNLIKQISLWCLKTDQIPTFLYK